MDTDTDRVSAGIEAENLLARLRPYFDGLRDRAIAALITHQRNETLTDDLMRIGVATLAALDELEKSLTHRIRLGKKDLEESQRSTL